MNIFDRTFHPDEANQAFTTGRLLETGTYRYDPQDHHGPTLYYAAATLQKAAGHHSIATLDPTLLRCTPLIFAVATLVLGCLAIRKLTGRLWIGMLFALLLGTSPIFVFFATDFIQEMLLASFTMMMFWTGAYYIFYPTSSNNQTIKQSNNQTIKRPTWALLFGIATGLAFATKETSLLTFAAAGVSGLLLYFTRHHASDTQALKQSNTQTIILAFAGFLLTSVLFYSSFGANWPGVYNAFIAAPLSYLHRAAGSAASPGAAAHVHPWWQHFKWLFGDGGLPPVLIVGGLLLGFCALVTESVRKTIPAHSRTFFLFITLYATILTALYSTIPYKTPWCTLQLHIPLLLSALIGLMLFTMAMSTKSWPICLIIAISYSAALGREMLKGDSFLLAKIWCDPDSKQIPYNYASASPQVKELAALVLKQIAPESDNQTIKQSNNQATFAAIALPPEDTWPLPFYLRMAGDKIGYWTSFGELEALAGLGSKPSVVVVPAEEGHLVQPLFPHLKNTKRFEMRPHARVRAFW